MGCAGVSGVVVVEESLSPFGISQHVDFGECQVVVRGNGGELLLAIFTL